MNLDYSILDKILDEVGFYGEFPDLRDEEYLVMVTLYDYTARSYQLRTKTNADIDVVVVDETNSRPAKLAGRMFLYPPTSEQFKVISPHNHCFMSCNVLIYHNEAFYLTSQLSCFRVT